MKAVKALAREFPFCGPYACFVACQDSRWFTIIGTRDFKLIHMNLVSKSFTSLEEVKINLQLRFPECMLEKRKNIARKTRLARVQEAYEIAGISQDVLAQHVLDNERLV